MGNLKLNKTMGKSELKKLFYMREVEGCFESEDGGSGVVAWCNDTSIDIMGMQFLRSAPKGQDEFLVTLEQAVESLFLPCLQAIQEPDCKVYIQCFDKSNYVVAAKQPEQTKRDAAKVTREGSDPRRGVPMSYRMHQLAVQGSHDRFSNLGEVEQSGFQASVGDWKKAVLDRNTKKHVVSHICSRARSMLPNLLRKANVPADKYIVIDFHNTESASGQDIIVASSSGDLSADEDITAQFRNELGEFDVAHLHHLNSPMVRKAVDDHGNDAKVLVKSTDADIIAVHLLQSQVVLPPYVRILSTLPASLTKETHRTSVLINPQGILTWIHNVFENTELEDPVEQFVKLFILSGTDFVDGVPGKGTFSLLDQYIRKVSIASNRAPTAEQYVHATLHSIFGTKSASVATSKRKQRCLEVDLKQRNLRAEWVLKYWKWSYADPTQIPSHLGMGWAIKGNQHVCAEDLHVSNSTIKKIKMF